MVLKILRSRNLVVMPGSIRYQQYFTMNCTYFDLSRDDRRNDRYVGGNNRRDYNDQRGHDRVGDQRGHDRAGDQRGHDRSGDQRFHERGGGYSRDDRSYGRQVSFIGGIVKFL